MTDQDDIDAAIVTNAEGPLRVRVGNQEVEQHPIADQIAAANHVASQQAATKPGAGLRFQQITPVYR